MKSTTILFLLVFSIFQGNAQKILCGYDMVMEKINQDMNYAEDVKRVFNEAKLDQLNDRFEETFVIPITVHVIWKDSIENIDDSLIIQQVEVLTENFRRLNANADDIRPIFADVVGDPKIEFELTEIIRIKTDTIFNVDVTIPDYVKRTNEGGSDAVDSKKNLNIWVCNIQPLTFQGQIIGRLLGYSYPPAGLSHWPDNSTAPSEELDGVVLDYRMVGRNNPLTLDIPGLTSNLRRQGRIAVHEVGHYLGLRHTWADAVVFFGEDGCAVDDGVDDTPNCAEQSNFKCNYDKNTCTDTSGVDLPDMIENYMDYSSEACMNSFTNGQIQIMRSVLRNVRCGLVGECEHVANDDVIQRTEVQIFPNPANDYVKIVNNNKGEKFNVAIYNSIGRLVSEFELSNSLQIDISNYEDGLYFFEIQHEDHIEIKKVVFH